MSRTGRRPIRLLLLVAATLTACAGAPPRAADPAPNAPVATGSDWLQIPLHDLDGHPVTLAKALAGRPALLNLWAPWCERCKTELPDLERLSRQTDSCGVIIGIAVGEDAAHTAAFVRQRGLAYLQYVDENFRLADTLRQGRVPTTLVVDGEGKIVHVGLALDRSAVGALEAALGRSDAQGRCKRGRPPG